MQEEENFARGFRGPEVHLPRPPRAAFVNDCATLARDGSGFVRAAAVANDYLYAIAHRSCRRDGIADASGFVEGWDDDGKPWLVTWRAKGAFPYADVFGAIHIVERGEPE